HPTHHNPPYPSPTRTPNSKTRFPTNSSALHTTNNIANNSQVCPSLLGNGPSQQRIRNKPLKSGCWSRKTRGGLSDVVERNEEMAHFRIDDAQATRHGDRNLP